MKIGSVEIVNAVVCDDVRREINGKEILIGVYGDVIILPSFPVDLVLLFWIQARAPEGKHEMTYRLVNSGGVVFFEAGIMADIKVANEVSSFAFGGALQVQGEVKLSLEGRQADTEWVTVTELKVRRGHVPGMSGPPN